MKKIKIIMERVKVYEPAVRKLKCLDIAETLSCGNTCEKNKIDIALEKYYTYHKYCPKCGSADICEKMSGFPMYEDWTKIKATNGCRCSECGWTGIGHELIGDKE